MGCQPSKICTTHSLRHSYVLLTLDQRPAINSGVKGEVSLVRRQWKALEHGTLSGLRVSVRDADDKLLPFAYLSVVLEVRKRK